MASVAAVDNRLRQISTGVKGQSARASGRQAGGEPVCRLVAYAETGSKARSRKSGRLGTTVGLGSGCEGGPVATLRATPSPESNSHRIQWVVSHPEKSTQESYGNRS
jgi:hypothetical protein